LFDTNNKNQTDNNSTNDDYDYVNLESKAKFDQENEEVKRTLPHEMKRAFDVLVAQSEDLPVLPTAANDQVRISFLKCREIRHLNRREFSKFLYYLLGQR
jgi:hypothetical protein